MSWITCYFQILFFTLFLVSFHFPSCCYLQIFKVGFVFPISSWCQRADDEKRGNSAVSEVVFHSFPLRFLSVLLLPTPFRANCLLKEFVPFFCMFSLSQLLWLFSLFSPHSRWHFLAYSHFFSHYFLSASAPLIFAIYGFLSRCSNSPLLDVYQIWV